MRNYGIHGHHGPYVPCSDYDDPQPAPTAFERTRARRRKRNVVIALNIIFWCCAIAAALIQWMP